MDNKSVWSMQTELGNVWYATIKEGKVHFSGTDSLLEGQVLSLTPQEAMNALEGYDRNRGFAKKWILDDGEFRWFESIILMVLPMMIAHYR